MKKKVCVLMSTYNGEKYIFDQVKSVFEQKDVDVFLLIRDDGSSDNTVNIIKSLSYPNLKLIEGKNRGYACSFMMLLKEAKNIETDFFAFCDQDDVWLPEKLITAVSNMDTNSDRGALYLSQAIIVDADLNRLNVGFHSRKVSLGPVLAHNFAIGCTMVFDKKLRNILDIEIDNMELRCGHDSWVFLVALAISSFVYFDKSGYVLYRQHGKNASGKIRSFKQALNAIKKILYKWKNVRCDSAKSILSNYGYLLNEKNNEILQIAAEYQKSKQKKKALLSSKDMLSDYKFVDFLFKYAVLRNLF